MTQDQNQALAARRAELDRIDDQILDLIERRLGASAVIAAIKASTGDHRLKLRPRRQAQILQRLKGRASRAAPELIDGVWREIMAHSLHAQAPMEIVVAPSHRPDMLKSRLRSQFGSAGTIRMAVSAAEAVRRALDEEAIAILPEPIDDDSGKLAVFDVVHGEDGETLGYAVGRVAAADIAIETPPSDSVASSWTPASWRRHPGQQLPEYSDARVLGEVERKLSASAPLVEVSEIQDLKSALARVAAGDGFMLQGGDCAESFSEFNADKVRVTYNLLLRMGAMLRAASGGEVVHLARIAGQFAKPRSTATETVSDVTLPSYRGDAVNGAAFTASARAPDPERLLQAYRQAQVTVELLEAYASASYADLPKVHREVGLKEPTRPIDMFTSHEALLLNYEQALTRYDEQSGQWWATSGHMVWIGDRTRQLDGAHVEFARGVANPLGLKCGPSLATDDLLRLMDRLDPDNEPGRLVLIGRFGAANVAEHLPGLMQATRRAGRSAIWSIDPMHGNTRTMDGLKTRAVADILAEIASFFEVASGEGVHPGGVHLEMTGSDVTECLGGSLKLARKDLERSYLTHCDPRLNESQALDVAHAVADLLRPTSVCKVNAA